MNNTTARACLDRTVFEGLDPENLDRLAEIATPVEWPEGATIYREGVVDTHLYLMDEGLVAIEMTIPGRGRTTILTVGPGEIFGWSALFDRRPKAAAARAIRPTRGLALDADRLRSLCDADPRLGYEITRRILQTVSERLKAARIQLFDMFRGPEEAGR